MTKGVAGIGLDRFEAPVEAALETYGKTAGDGLRLDVLSARRLKRSEGLVGYSAKSTTDAVYHGREVGKLIVVAFAPGEGLGDAVTYPSDETIPLAERLKKPLVLPMAKPHTASELMFSIASFRAGEPDGDPAMFANNLTLLGLAGWHQSRQYGLGVNGELGSSSSSELEAALSGETEASPTVSVVVGESEEGRFGDPGAVFNPHEDVVQVSAFLALQDHLPTGTILSLKDSLGLGTPDQLPA